MLSIQKFLKSGGTLQELSQRHEIDYNIDHNLNLVVFNYRALASMINPIVRESRGLVLEMDTWEVVAKSLDAFFEPQSLDARATLSEFDWSTAKAQEKLDGALICMYYYKGAWHVSMRFSADGDWIVWSINAKPNNITWTEYVKLTLKDMGTSWEEFTSKLNKDIYYTFEIVGPENRVVVVYTKRQLYLVGAIDKHTLKEVDIYSLDFPELKVPYKEVRSLDEAWRLVLSEPEPYDYEGRIVIDGNFRRLKMRNPVYVELVHNYSTDDEYKQLKQLKHSIVNALTHCQPLSETVETPTGNRILGDIKIGDKVYGRNQKIQTVVGVQDFENMPVLKIVFESGEIRCSETHPIFISSQRIDQACYLGHGRAIMTPNLQKRRVIRVQNDGIETVRALEVTPDHEYVSNGILNHNMAQTKFSVGLSIFSEFASMARFLQDAYQKNKSKVNPELMSIWPKAFEKLDEGMAMSEILDSSTNDEIIDALRRYHEQAAKMKSESKTKKSGLKTVKSESKTNSETKKVGKKSSKKEPL